MTKTKRSKTGQDLGRPAMRADEVFWLGLAAQLTRKTMIELASELVREPVRKILAKKGLDPDRVWAEYEATRQ